VYVRPVLPRKIVKGLCRVAGSGKRFVGVTPSVIFLSASRYYSRNIGRTSAENNRIILFLLSSSRRRGGTSLLATDRRPPALAFAYKLLSLSLLLYFRVRCRRWIEKDKTAAFLSGNNRRLIDDLHEARATDKSSRATLVAYAPTGSAFRLP